jgi:DNA-binding response OmpR family regulator
VSLEIIQIIEDDPAQVGLLDHTLRKARYRTNVAFDGQTGLVDINRLKPALVLLDVMLPGMDGYEVCRRLRENPLTRHLPIILITALNGEEHRIAGLEYGADDYIAKPFSPREVVSRVRAVLRRTLPSAIGMQTYLCGNLTVLESHVVISLYGRHIDLSEAQWRVVSLLARQPGQVVTRDEIVSVLWGNDGLLHQHELDRLISALKWKLDQGGEETVVSMPSVGYLLRPQTSNAPPQ